MLHCISNSWRVCINILQQSLCLENIFISNVIDKKAKNRVYLNSELSEILIIILFRIL